MARGLTIVKASAGSGKTEALVLEYLKLALEEPDHFDKILAITFTNKAAGEMKQRTLKILHGLSEGQMDRRSDELCKALNIRHEVLKERAKHLYHQMLHRFYGIRFSTIDALLQSILRSMARELGLSASYLLETDILRVEEELLSQLYQKLEDDRQLLYWLRAFMEEQQQAEKSWDPDQPLRAFMAHLFSENSRQLFRDHWPDLNKAEWIKTLVEQTLNTICQSWQFKARRCLDILDQDGLDLDIFPQDSLIVFFLSFLSNLEWKNPVFEKLDEKIIKLRQHGIPFRLKSTIPKEKKVAFQRALENGLQEQLNGLKGDIIKHYPRFKTFRNIRKGIYQYGLLAQFHALLEQWKRAHHTQLVQDAPYLVAEILKHAPGAWIFERTSQGIRHILMDEFQDTSWAQWECLKPLAEEALAGGHYVFAVGDPKQSIYGWRGATPAIMQQSLPEIAMGIGVKPHILERRKNYRSAPQIIEFNNALFELLVAKSKDIIASWINGMDLPSCQEVVAKLCATYADVKQMSARENTAEGKVVLWWYSAAKKSERKAEDFEKSDLESLTEGRPEMETIFKVLQELEEEGYTAGDVAILARTNKEVNDIVDGLNLLAEQGSRPFPNAAILSSRLVEPNRAPAVQFLVAGLRYLSDPLQIYYQIRFYAAFLGLHGVSEGDVALQLWDHSKATAWIQRLPQVKGRISEIVRQWMEHFDFERLCPGQLYYIYRFLDQIHQFEKNHASGVAEFLNYYDQKQGRNSSKTPLPEIADALKVFTMHEVKGLEFPCTIVIPPGLRGVKIHGGQSWMLVPLGSNAKGTHEFFPFSFNGKTHKNSLTEEAYSREVALRFQEELNLLYVACTRAIKRLYLVLPHPGNPTEDSWAAVLKGLIWEDTVKVARPFSEMLNQGWLRLVIPSEQEI
ncbi:MAG: UvrD-helicase domain-containing protein [Flavobacteriales bacterium]|nr:UvrD-helicase domain-containing protein [Flavobacteriales bacterium]